MVRQNYMEERRLESRWLFFPAGCCPCWCQVSFLFCFFFSITHQMYMHTNTTCTRLRVCPWYTVKDIETNSTYLALVNSYSKITRVFYRWTLGFEPGRWRSDNLCLRPTCVTRAFLSFFFHCKMELKLKTCCSLYLKYWTLLSYLAEIKIE